MIGRRFLYVYKRVSDDARFSLVNNVSTTRTNNRDSRVAFAFSIFTSHAYTTRLGRVFFVFVRFTVLTVHEPSKPDIKSNCFHR